MNAFEIVDVKSSTPTPVSGIVNIVTYIAFPPAPS